MGVFILFEASSNEVKQLVPNLVIINMKVQPQKLPPNLARRRKKICQCVSHSLDHELHKVVIYVTLPFRLYCLMSSIHFNELFMWGGSQNMSSALQHAMFAFNCIDHLLESINPVFAIQGSAGAKKFKGTLQGKLQGNSVVQILTMFLTMF